MRLPLFMFVLLAGCQSPPNIKIDVPPTSQVSLPPINVGLDTKKSEPLFVHTYEKGLVKFVNRVDLPNTIYSIRGKLEISLFEGYAIIKDSDEGPDKTKVYVIPRERLLYIEDTRFGEFD